MVGSVVVCLHFPSHLIGRSLILPSGVRPCGPGRGLHYQFSAKKFKIVIMLGFLEMVKYNMRMKVGTFIDQ